MPRNYKQKFVYCISYSFPSFWMGNESGRFFCFFKMKLSLKGSCYSTIATYFILYSAHLSGWLPVQRENPGSLSDDKPDKFHCKMKTTSMLPMEYRTKSPSPQSHGRIYRLMFENEEGWIKHTCFNGGFLVSHPQKLDAHPIKMLQKVCHTK